MQTGNRICSRVQGLKAIVSLIFLITSLSTDRAHSAYVTSVCVGNMEQRFRGPFAPRAQAMRLTWYCSWVYICFGGTTNERLISIFCRLGGEVRTDADYPRGPVWLQLSLSVICYQQSDIAPTRSAPSTPLPPLGSGRSKLVLGGAPRCPPGMWTRRYREGQLLVHGSIVIRNLVQRRGLCGYGRLGLYPPRRRLRSARMQIVPVISGAIRRLSYKRASRSERSVKRAAQVLTSAGGRTADPFNSSSPLQDILKQGVRPMGTFIVS